MDLSGQASTFVLDPGGTLRSGQAGSGREGLGDQDLALFRFGGGARGRRAAGIRALELLDAVGLADQAGKRPAQLAGGQRQRVNIARALTNEPTALVIDEPTSALDQERGASILDLILRLTGEHDTATVLVTHDQHLLPMLDSVHNMVDGTLSVNRATVTA